LHMLPLLQNGESIKRNYLQIKKESLLVNMSVAGFVINGINYPAMIEAMQLVEQEVATVVPKVVSFTIIANFIY
jgi:hypothetical protein